MKYHCSGCDYIYDEIVGDEDLWIEPKTFFDHLPSDFFCPFCDTHKDDFIVLPEEINYPLNVQKLTPFEQEHFPEYEIKEDLLKYYFSETQHPNDENHFIYKVALYDDSGDEILKHQFQFWDEVSWEFDIDYLDDFELRVYCLKDGIFSSGIIQR